MERRIHLYVSRKNAFVWLMVLAMLASSVLRILPACMFDAYSPALWGELVLPVAATVLFILIVLIAGDEMLYKTAVPVFAMCVYYAIRPHSIAADPLILALYCTCLLFYFVMYTLLTSGRIRFPLLLTLMGIAPLGMLAYLHQRMMGMELPMASVWYIMPDYLFFGGLTLLTFAIRVHPIGEYHPTWGDRSDGRRVRTLPAMAQVSPYIMVERNDATNQISDSFEISHVERYIRNKRREGYANFGIIHVLLACYCRGVAKFPAINRFLSGQKVYSRGEDIQFCMTIKKEMSTDAPDTVIKVHLNPNDTAIDVYNKINVEIEKVKNTPLDSNFDNTAGALTLIPGVFLKFVVWLLKTLDYFGLLPGFLLEVSPFHGSVFFTSMGSLGIPPIYHHLYNFGNLPVFCAFGLKRREIEPLEDGTLVQRKYVDLKMTTDERIVDGFYYATFFKYFKRLMRTPDVLDNPPEEVLRDID